MASGSGKTPKLRKVRLLGIIALFTITLLAMSVVGLAHAANENAQKTQTIIAMKPLSIIDYSLGPSEEFEMNVTALDVAYLHGFQIRLTYDASVIGCSAVQEGALLESYGNTTDLYNRTDNTGGYVYVSLNLTSPEAMANSSGSLVTLTFRVLNRGETAIQFKEVNLYDSNGTSLSYVTYDGYFNNKFLVDVAMPLTLFSVTLVSLFLNQKTEGKLKTTLEDKEFKVRDTVLLVALMAAMVSSIFLLRQLVAPLMILFLFSYSALLFIFTYLFSTKRWYVAIAPPAVFVLLYLFLNGTLIWSNYLITIYAVVFAVLITLYVGSLFTWKPMLVFTMLEMIADIILVLVTGTMIQVADTAFRSLSLPEMVAVPIVPPIVTARGWMEMALGLGDFFFAGLLGIQTFKKFGKKIAVISIVAMTMSFFVFETILLTYWKIPFPGTVMIMCGWAPIAIGKILKDRISKARREKSNGKT